MVKVKESVALICLISLFWAFQGCGKFSVKSSSEAAENAEGSQEPARQFETLGEISAAAPARRDERRSFKPFKVYSDANSPDNHYTPSGWMGDYADIKFSEETLTNPHSGSTCIMTGYSAKGTQGARWAGVYWQNPSNNWGTRPGGYDLTGARKLTFWARGSKGGERIEEFKLGGITGEYADSDVAGIGPAVLTPEWQEFSIDLDGKDLSSISGGFCWVANADSNPEGLTFYLDDIQYE